jgi:hypothetical protein
MIPTECPMIRRSRIELYVWTCIVSTGPTEIARWFRTWDPRLNSHSVASVSQDVEVVPSFHSVTPGPSLTTTPALSWPRPCSPLTTIVSPILPCFQKWTSLNEFKSHKGYLPQIPVALTWTITSPSLGSGMPISTTLRSWDGLVCTARLGASNGASA